MNIGYILIGAFTILMAILLHLVKDKTYPAHGNPSDPVKFFERRRNLFSLIGIIFIILGLIF